MASAGILTGCRACGGTLGQSFIDLGAMPFANRLLAADELGQAEPLYPLHVRVCADCLLVQHDLAAPPEELFRDYVYFSSFSGAWVEHARRFALQAIERQRLGPESLVVEIASNDGYLLQHFVAAGVPVQGIEPAANVAEVAIAKGVPSLCRFFGTALADEMVADGRRADLVVANNVLAHAPATGDFLAGIARLLKPEGRLAAEFPHLLELIQGVQLDTIYHEHFFYWSLQALEPALHRAGLRLIEAERLPTHGGSLRIHAVRADHPAPPAEGPGLLALRAAERAARLDRIEGYRDFAARALPVRDGLLAFFDRAAGEGHRVMGFGAAAKGVTLLNWCGIGSDRLVAVADETPAKIGRWLPGCRIPVVDLAAVRAERPDYLLVLPWNHAPEIMAKLSWIRDWGGAFVLPVPATRIVA